MVHAQLYVTFYSDMLSILILLKMRMPQVLIVEFFDYKKDCLKITESVTLGSLSWEIILEVILSRFSSFEILFW